MYTILYREKYEHITFELYIINKIVPDIFPLKYYILYNYYVIIIYNLS